LQAASSSKKANFNIKIPDLISNAANSKSNDFKRLIDKDDSDYEIDTRKNYAFGSTSNGQAASIQMNHEVKFKKLLLLNFAFY
jgi:hypothetical protein